jgi:hypothetical protein
MPDISPDDDVVAKLSDGLVVVSENVPDGTVIVAPFQMSAMSVCMTSQEDLTRDFESLTQSLQTAQMPLADLMSIWMSGDMSSTPDGPLYDYQGQLEELLAAKRPEIAAVWPTGPGWGNPRSDPLQDILDFKEIAMRRSTMEPAHPVHQAPEVHWKRYLAASVTGQRDLTRNFEIPCWLDEALAFMRPVVPDPIRGGTFFYCPWIERLSGGLRSCGVGHVTWATGTRFRSARAYRRHYRRCHLS